MDTHTQIRLLTLLAPPPPTNGQIFLLRFFSISVFSVVNVSSAAAGSLSLFSPFLPSGAEAGVHNTIAPLVSSVLLLLMHPLLAAEHGRPLRGAEGLLAQRQGCWALDL